MGKPSPWLGVLVAILIGAGALAVGLVDLHRKQNTSSLSAEISALKTQLAQVEGLQQTGNETVSKTERRVAEIADCLPELTAYVNGLTPEVEEGKVFLPDDQRVSSLCTPILYGSKEG